jgi:RNA polymerase subunit RPABC4/transcription elongation factor Spt4
MSTKLDEYTCPRCLGGIPNDEQRGQYIGAMSRTDNKTEICSPCGTGEAIEDWTGGLTPQSRWLINQ